MAILDIRIHGRTYQMACDDGQEKHVRELAQQVDARVAALARRMGSQAQEAQLLALTALLLCDELNEARQTASNLRLHAGDNEALEQYERETQERVEQSVAAAIAEIADDIEKIAHAIETGKV